MYNSSDLSQQTGASSIITSRRLQEMNTKLAL